MINTHLFKNLSGFGHRIIDYINLEKVFHALIVFFIMLSFGFSAFHGDQVVHMPNTLARFDSTLFSTDFNAVTMSSGFNTQLFIDLLFIVFLRLGLSWLHISGILYVLFLFIFSLGIVKIVHTIMDRHQLFVATFFAFCIQLLIVGSAFGINSIWLNAFYNQTPAWAISIWGLSYALQEKPRWLASSVTVAIACLFHISAAFYMYVVIFALMVPTIVQKKEYKLLLTSIPILFVGTLSYGLFSIDNVGYTLSSSEHVEIYSILRHPHHHLPSAWSQIGMLNFALYALLLLPFGWICAAKEERDKFVNKWMLPTILLSIIAVLWLGATHLFIEVIPWRLVSNMYPGRFFAAFRFWLLVYLCYCVFMLFKQKQYVCVMFLASVIFANDNYFL